jgi:hypothetical protein
VGIREKLNDRPGLTAAVTGVVIVAVVALIVWRSAGSNAGNGQAYYTTDDGAHWFTGDAKQIPPFDKGGQQAVKVNLYKCADGTVFVGYLEKYSADAKRKLHAAAASKVAPALDRSTMTLVKKPGDANWVNGHDKSYGKIIDVHCPADQSDQVEPVLP